MHHTVAGTTRLVASNGGAVLAALRVDQGYEQQSAGDIVRDLAGRTGVDTGPVENGPSLPYYVVDSRSTAWEHVAKLAALSGFAAWIGADAALHFGPLQAGAPAQTFTYGQDILELDALEAAAAARLGEGRRRGRRRQPGQRRLELARPGLLVGHGQRGLGRSRRARPGRRAPKRGRGERCRQRNRREGEARRPERRVCSSRAPRRRPSARRSPSRTRLIDTLNGSWVVRGVRHRLVKARGYTSLLLLAKGDT